eukprot:GSMAST32.ASY1.ANO1.75.1 assembled CDS
MQLSCNLTTRLISTTRFHWRIQPFTKQTQLKTCKYFTSIANSTSNSTSTAKAETNTNPFASFRKLGVSPELADGLANLDIASDSLPTHIQKECFEVILSGKNVVLGAETGSGKTLGYLMPVIQRLKDQQLHGNGRAAPKRPHVIVLTPSRELSQQVFQVAKTLSHSARYRCGLAIGGQKMNKNVKKLMSGVDVLVSNPGRVKKLWDNDALYFSHVECVIIDEADTLLTEGFQDELDSLFNSLQSPCQYILVGASFSSSVQKVLKKNFVDLIHISSPSLHYLPKGLQQKFIRPNANDKYPMLLEVLEVLQPTIVFCNSIDSCRATEYALSEAGFHTFFLKYFSKIHGGIPPRLRQDNYNNFILGMSTILVATDVASRGLDLPSVTRVVNFDFPRTSAEYMYVLFFFFFR